jgi:hypothetical protein
MRNKHCRQDLASHRQPGNKGGRESYVRDYFPLADCSPSGLGLISICLLLHRLHTLRAIPLTQWDDATAAITNGRDCSALQRGISSSEISLSHQPALCYASRQPRNHVSYNLSACSISRSSSCTTEEDRGDAGGWMVRLTMENSEMRCSALRFGGTDQRN